MIKKYIYTHMRVHMCMYIWWSTVAALRHGTWQLPPWSPPWISLFDTARDSKLINPASNTDMKVNNIYIYKPNITPTRPNIYPHVFLLAQYVEPFARRRQMSQKALSAMVSMKIIGSRAPQLWQNGDIIPISVWFIYGAYASNVYR